MLPKVERKQAIPQSDDVEKGLPASSNIMESFVPERKVVYLVERSGVTWRHWLLMGCTTWLGWMMFFVLVGALAGPEAQVEVSPSATYNVATFNGPVVVPLGTQFVTSENNMHYFAVIGIPDGTTSTDPAEEPAYDYSDYFSIPFLSSQVGQPKSDPSDLKKLLTLQPGYHAEEGVFVTEPIPSAAGKDLLMALDMSTATADEDQQSPVNSLSALQTKLQEMMKQSQDGVVIEVAVTASNDTRSEATLEEADDRSPIDPGLFASVPVVHVDPYYISPKDVQMNWFEALQACWGLGMQLVAIEDEAENEVILQLISKDLHPGDKVDFWTSGTNLWSHDRRRLYWATTGAEFSYTFWHLNNPNYPDLQNCVQVTNNLESPSNGSLRWNDYGCYAKNRFICEVPTPSPAAASQGAVVDALVSEVPTSDMEQQEFSSVLFEDIPQQLL